MRMQSFKSKLGSKSTLLKLITSYILLTAIILAVSTLTLYNGYKRQITEQTNNVSRQILNQANYYTDYTVGWAKLFIYQLYLDRDIYKLMYENNPTNSQNVLMGTMKIRQAATLVPLIHSIYIYNHKNGMFYSSLGDGTHQSLFNDQDVIKLLRENNQTFSVKFIPRQITVDSYGSPNRKNILTLTLTNVKSSADNLPDGAIILNLDANNAESYFKNNISARNNDLFAISERGKVIFHPNTALYLKDISSEKHIQQILSSRQAEDNFILDIAGTPSIVNYLKSPQLGLIFINITAYDTLLGTINKMVRLILLVVAVTLFIGVCFAVYSSRNIYQPIDKAVNYLKNITPFDNVRDELDYLVVAVDKILNTPSSLKNLSEEDINLVKEKLLLGILMDTVDDYEKLRDKIEELELKISNGQNFAVVIIKIDNYKVLKQNNPYEKLTEIKAGLQSVLKGNSEVAYEMLQIEESEIILITGFNRDLVDSGKAYAHLLDFLAWVQKEAKQKLDITLSAGIGDFVGGFSAISTSYRNAKDYLVYRYKYGNETVLNHEKAAARIREGYRYDDGLEQNIFSALKLGNLQKAESELDKMLAEAMDYSYYELSLTLTQLALNSKKQITNLLQMSNQSLYIDIQEFKQLIDNLENPEEVKRWFLDLYKITIETLKDKKVSRKKDLAERVIKYIEENYQDPQLSLETVAEYFNISPNYLRLKFKEAETKSISTYINELRFEKAKQLLETTDLTVKEIAARIGLNNYNYFYTAFKKYYGLSPNQFRSNLGAKNE